MGFLSRATPLNDEGSSAVVVTEESLPRRLQEHDVTDRRAVNEQVTVAYETDKKNGKLRWKRIIMVLIVAFVVTTIVDVACHDNVRTWLQQSFDWIEENPEAGVIVFAGIFCVATLLFVPGLLLTIAAGIAFGRALGFGFGLLWGSVAVLVGALVACLVSFYLGRYVLHEQAQAFAKRYRLLGAVNTAIERNGIKVMILLRLSPLVPFSGFNFIAGLTKVSLQDYLAGCIGIVPGTLAFVYIGASTAGTMNDTEAMMSGEGDKTSSLIRLITLVVGATAAVLAIAAVTVYARRALKQALVDSKLDACDNHLDAEFGSTHTDRESRISEETKESP